MNNEKRTYLTPEAEIFLFETDAITSSVESDDFWDGSHMGDVIPDSFY